MVTKYSTHNSRCFMFVKEDADHRNDVLDKLKFAACDILVSIIPVMHQNSYDAYFIIYYTSNTNAY